MTGLELKALLAWLALRQSGTTFTAPDEALRKREWISRAFVWLVA